MEFDKNKVYTSLNADELKIGSKVVVANSMYELKEQALYKSDKCKIVEIDNILSDNFQNRFRIKTYTAYHFEDNDLYDDYALAYLISEPEEKKLKWTDLKVGDIVKNIESEREYLVIAIDRFSKDDHICTYSDWVSDEELANAWEKVND